MGERVAVVMSGAAARGAFQAGALARLVPALVDQGYAPTVFLGTSAGSINTALWGSFADLGPQACGEAVLEVWRAMDRGNVFAHPAGTVLLRDAPRLLWSAWGAGHGLPGVLDTRPLTRTATQHLDCDRLARNVKAGIVEAVGVAATRMPPESAPIQQSGPASARTVVFLHTANLDPAGIADPDRAVDLAAGPIGVEHVLASSAIPVAFPAQRVTAPPSAAGWYLDGGVRLNTPLRPALALGAERVVVIAAMSTEYGDPLEPSPASSPAPDVADAGALLLHAVLADRMAEDLRSMRALNRSVTQAAAGGVQLTSVGGRAYRRVPVLAVAPEPGSLGALADEILARLGANPLRLAWDSDKVALDRLLRSIGDGPGRRELLSYLLFDSEYFNAQIALGAQAADAALAGGWRTD